jgi:hypothetical protein
MSDDDRPFIGPIETGPWPQTIPGFVVEPGPWPRVMGYDLYRDLARHYRWGEFVLTTLRGETPQADEGVAFEVALAFVAPCSIADAPAHAARAAALVGTRAPSVAAVGAIAAAEEAQHLVRESSPMLAWLRAREGPAPAPPRPAAPMAVLGALRDALPDRLRDAVPNDVPLDVTTACLAVLQRCGLVSDVLLQHAVLLARLPTTLAESRQLGRRFKDYPMDRPRFRYVEDDE